MTKKKKVLFVSHDASRTGAPLFLRNLLRWLRANTDLQFSIVLRDSGPLEADFRELGETLLQRDITDVFALLRDVSLIYSNTCTNGTFLEMLPVGTIPVVTHAHEMGFNLRSYGEENFGRVKKQTKMFIACSHAVATSLQMVGVAAEKIMVIHGAISVDAVVKSAEAKSPEALRQEHHWDHDFVVTGCGTAVWLKGADLFVQLARLVHQKLAPSRKALFLWIGILPPDERGQILTLDAHRLGLQDVVAFVGEQENPHPYVNLADVFCLCSREDSFPLVALEAAALEKPILCFQRSGGTEELCARGAGLTVPYLDLHAMADALVSLASDKTRRREIGARAKEIVRGEFDLSVIAPRLAQAIETSSDVEAKACFARAQVYHPTAEGYSENASQRIFIHGGKWSRLSFDLPPPMAGGRLRFDPMDRAGVALIAGLRIQSQSSGKILWEAKAPEHFDQFAFATSVCRLPNQRLLAIRGQDNDPHFLLPPLPGINEEIRLTAWMCAAEEAELGNLLTRASGKTAREGKLGIKLLRLAGKLLKT